MKTPRLDKATRFALKRETAERLRAFADDAAIVEFFADVEATLVERLIIEADPEKMLTFQSRLLAVRALKSYLARAVAEGERAVTAFLEETETHASN